MQRAVAAAPSLSSCESTCSLLFPPCQPPPSSRRIRVLPLPPLIFTSPSPSSPSSPWDGGTSRRTRTPSTVNPDIASSMALGPDGMLSDAWFLGLELMTEETTPNKYTSQHHNCESLPAICWVCAKPILSSRGGGLDAPPQIAAPAPRIGADLLRPHPDHPP